MKLIATLVAAAFAAPAFAQNKPEATPAPSWQGGRPASMAESTLHPFAPHMTGRPGQASCRSTSSRSRPASRSRSGPTAFPRRARSRSATRARCSSATATRRTSTRSIDQGGKREVKTILKGLELRRTASPSTRARCTSPSATASRATTASRSKLDNPPEGKVVVDNLDPEPRRPATSGSSWRWGPTASSTSTSARRATS